MSSPLREEYEDVFLRVRPATAAPPVEQSAHEFRDEVACRLISDESVMIITSHLSPAAIREMIRLNCTFVSNLTFEVMWHIIH